MDQQLIRRNTGFTLIEMMVMLGLLSIFSIFLVSLFTISQNAKSIGEASAAAQNESKRAVEWMVKELREGSVSAPGGVTIDANSSRIIFPIPDQISASQIVSWRSIQYALNSQAGTIERTENAGAPAVLARNVQNLQFTLTNDIVTMTVVTNANSAKGAALTSTLTSRAMLRN